MNFEFMRCTPESQGISSALLADVLKFLDQLEYMKSIVILRHGKLICEAEWAPYEKDIPYSLWSLSKSFTSCAIGSAQAEKRFSIHDKLVDFFPEYRSCVTDERMFKVTLQDLLTMRSGHDQCAFAFANADSAGDWVRGYLSSPLVHEPGTHFAYNSLGTYMLSAVLRRVTGLNVREYLKPRLFEPLGIEPGAWDQCPGGTDLGGFGFHLKTMDIAKFAQLVLDKGVWQGVQLLPADYLEEAQQPHADNSMNDHPDWKCGYGYQFWRSRHGSRGDGACGQYAIMLPDKDMAIAINSSMSDMGRVLELFWEKLLPGAGEEALPEDNAAFAEFEKVVSTLAIPVLPEGKKSAIKSCTLEFFNNVIGIKKGKIDISADNCVLSFETPRGVEELRAGFGKFEKSTLQLQERSPQVLAACASWKEENLLEISVLHLNATFRDTWHLEFKGDKVQFNWRTQCSLFRPEMPPLLAKII